MIGKMFRCNACQSSSAVHVCRPASMPSLCPTWACGRGASRSRMGYRAYRQASTSYQENGMTSYRQLAARLRR